LETNKKRKNNMPTPPWKVYLTGPAKTSFRQSLKERRELAEKEPPPPPLTADFVTQISHSAASPDAQISLWLSHIELPTASSASFDGDPNQRLYDYFRRLVQTRFKLWIDTAALRPHWYPALVGSQVSPAHADALREAATEVFMRLNPAQQQPPAGLSITRPTFEWFFSRLLETIFPDIDADEVRRIVVEDASFFCLTHETFFPFDNFCWYFLLLLEVWCYQPTDCTEFIVSEIIPSCFAAKKKHGTAPPPCFANADAGLPTLFGSKRNRDEKGQTKEAAPSSRLPRLC
jgi:hypothetical protein